MSTAEGTEGADRRFLAFGFVAVVVVLGFLAWILYVRIPAPASADLRFLPAVNAALNSVTTCFLVAGFIAIKRKQRTIHRTLMMCALTTSVLFLISYVTYHAAHGDTKYPADAAYRGLYLGVLASHIALSTILPFLAITVVVFAFRGRFEKHRRIARITFPIWLYVSVTGVLIFWMLRLATG